MQRYHANVQVLGWSEEKRIYLFFGIIFFSQLFSSVWTILFWVGQYIFRMNLVVILGDGGYAIAPYLVTPFRNPLTVAERAYNRLLTKERVLIEMMFGRLKKRFPILKNQVRLKTERIPNVIVACVVLYNIGIHPFTRRHRRLGRWQGGHRQRWGTGTWRSYRREHSCSRADQEERIGGYDYSYAVVKRKIKLLFHENMPPLIVAILKLYCYN